VLAALLVVLEQQLLRDEVQQRGRAERKHKHKERLVRREGMRPQAPDDPAHDDQRRHQHASAHPHRRCAALQTDRKHRPEEPHLNRHGERLLCGNAP
jgi:hypothetical protein